MTTILQILSDKNEPYDLVEMTQAIENAGIEIRERRQRVRGLPAIDIIIALGSAGVFTAFYKVICKFFEKNATRSLTIKYKGGEITINGHSLPEETALLNLIASEFPEQRSLAKEKKK